MDHKEQHHQQHQHEREQQKKERKEHEHKEEKSSLPFHPAWLVVVGVGSILTALLIWTVFLQ